MTETPKPDGNLVEPSWLGKLMGEVAFYREHSPRFGSYLRHLREDRGLSLRDAADQVGITFAKLQKMETGGRFRIDSLQLLFSIADLYYRPRAEVLEAAGIRVLDPEGVQEELEEEAAFERLVLHPALRPLHMDRRWLESFSKLQKSQWVEFARRLEVYVQNGGTIATVLSGTEDGNRAK